MNKVFFFKNVCNIFESLSADSQRVRARPLCLVRIYLNFIVLFYKLPNTMEKITPLYPCKQHVLYTVAEMACNNTLAYIADISAKSPSITTAYVNSIVEMIADAKALPDVTDREEPRMTARAKLIKKKQEAAKLFPELEYYIRKAFPADEVHARLLAAGYNEFRDSGTKPSKFDVFSSMLEKMVKFIGENEAALLQNNTMPPGFKATVTAAMTSYKELWDDFQDKKQETGIESSAKLTANNELYLAVMSLLDAGKMCFRSNSTLRKLFYFRALESLSQGNSKSGLKGRVLCDAPLSVISDLLVETTVVVDGIPEYRSTTTDKDGRFRFYLPSGTWPVTFSKAGFEPQTVERRIKVGTMHLVKLMMTPIAAATAVTTPAQEDGKAAPERGLMPGGAEVV